MKVPNAARAHSDLATYGHYDDNIRSYYIGVVVFRRQYPWHAMNSASAWRYAIVTTASCRCTCLSPPVAMYGLKTAGDFSDDFWRLFDQLPVLEPGAGSELGGIVRHPHEHGSSA